MHGRMKLWTVALAVATSLAGLLSILSSSAGAVAPDPNPWLQNRFLVMAHQGGEDEAPSNTLFAFKSAIRDRGADSLEMDVNLSSDGQLMVIHNDTYSSIACTHALCPGPDSSSEAHRPDSEINDLTAAQIQALDAGYWFRPGTYSHDYSLPDSAYPYRGVRTGAVPPPAGYSADDFVIPTLRQVLDTFPNTPLNIEIKMIKTSTADPANGGCVMDDGTQYCDDPSASIPVADALADLLDDPPYANRNDIIVVSFSDELIDEFHSQDDGGNVALAPGVDDTTAFVLSGTTPSPDVAAFQVPPKQLGFDVPDLLLGLRNSHGLGYAVHVWTNGDQDETDASYKHLYDLGVDGIMSSDPSRLASFLCANNIPHPNGTSRCPAQPAPPPAHKRKKCKKKRHKAAATKTAAGPTADTAKKKHCKKHKHKGHKRR